MPGLAAADDTTKNPNASSSSSYLLLVQHLIEKCLMFNMDQRECVEALSKHANIQPLITITVWNELEKENREFFSSYNLKNTNGKKEEYCSQAAAQQMVEEVTAPLRHEGLSLQDSSDAQN